nr:MAG TPA: hypothetical protein [Bacteriophage sp.]
MKDSPSGRSLMQPKPVTSPEECRVKERRKKNVRNK